MLILSILLFLFPLHSPSESQSCYFGALLRGENHDEILVLAWLMLMGDIGGKGPLRPPHLQLCRDLTSETPQSV